MNFIDYTLTADVSSELRRIILGRTDIITLDNGCEVRNKRWKYNKLKFSAEFPMLSVAAQNAIIHAFYAANAQLYAFRINDFLDNSAVEQPLTVPAGTKDPIQLYKTYALGPVTAMRPIQAIQDAKIMDMDNHLVAGVLDPILGLFTPQDPWANIRYTWSGTFDVWVRFGSDTLETTYITQDVAHAEIELWEVKVYR